MIPDEAGHPGEGWVGQVLLHSLQGMRTLVESRDSLEVLGQKGT